MAFKKVLKRAAISVILLSALVGNTYSAPPKYDLDKAYPIKLTSETSTLNIDKIYLTSCVDGQDYSTKNKEVRLEDKVRLNIVVEATLDGEKVYFSEANNVMINGKKVKTKQWDYDSEKITWYKVEAEKSSYNNWETGKFVLDTPTYKETKINEGENWSILADAKPTEILKDVNDGLGTMRYKVEFSYGNKTFSTPGKTYILPQGITNDVHRISFRKDDSFTGWMTSFFNLPYIYGSTEFQADNNVGLDCADFIVAAYRKTGHNIPYTYVIGLYAYSKIIADEKDVKITGDDFYHKGKPLIFGKDVKEGDLLVFAYSHVGVLYKDKSDPDGEFKGESDGVLNKYDVMIHIYFDNPKYEILDYCTSFSVLRLKN